ncbi:hypothetical protein LHP98_14200 [Rhodobacter sp. Har01]|uniref:hypothetical protein n=1 Tax=Rhodobacter sp. Har01 TaxID=2883999 RepID=UPI001D0911A0|nr:hypothetical protein [Rhodobacter sp. Har01]MCB6179272.1 hypothetical protein [Rhodobacter sp. Har01]
MPLVIDGSLARIEGAARVDEAETLVSFLETTADPVVDLGPTNHLHTAVLQVLMAYRPALATLPEDPVLLALLRPLLGEAGPELNRAA